MNLLFAAVSFLFFLLTLRKIFFWVWLWQIKEYRLDRLLVHLKETEQGKNIFFSKSSLFKLSAIFGFVLVSASLVPLSIYQIFILILFISELFVFYREIAKKTFKKPVITFKALILILLSFSLSFILYIFPFVEKFLWILLLDKLTPFLVGFFIFLFSFPSNIYIDIQIERAARKIRKREHLLVIAVTGSYGKSSTKEYLAQILSSKFKVAKTKGTNNTPIGIANSVLAQLKKDTQIFVVEMGAYKKGEIKELCEIVHPKIGIITAVSNQHLSLFGNIENTMKGKYELIESLPDDGLALFNGNSEKARSLFEKTAMRKVLYECLNSISGKCQKSGICAFNVETQKSSIAFKVKLKKETVEVKASLIGSHNVENILPGIFIAKHLGMSWKEILEAVQNLSPLPKTMEKYSLSNKATVIDDTFNANPDSILAALNYIKIYKGLKIFVMQPMIELGKNADFEHQKIAEEISKNCDYLFLTNKNYYKSILKGFENKKGKCLVDALPPKTILNFILNNTKKSDVVLFEGKESNAVLSKLL